MATLADKRAWLRENTLEDIPARGRLRPDLLILYDQAHPDDQPSDYGAAYSPGFTPGEDGWDLPEGTDPEMIYPDELEPPPVMQPERPPRTARAARAEKRAQPVTHRASSLLGKLLGEDTKKNAAKAKKKIPRTSLEKFISHRYRDFGKLLAPLSVPMSRCVQAQAAFAGVVWEDIVRDTIVDRGLQPLARAEDKLDKGFALVVTPLAVLAVEQAGVALQTGAITAQQFAVRQALTMPVLREGLRKQIEIGRLYADQIAAKLAEDLELDAEVDKLLAFIFAPPEGAVVEEPEMAGAAG